MTIPWIAHSSCAQRTAGFAAALLVSSLLLFTGTADAEPPASAAQEASELKVYKQRTKVTAEVACKIYERRPIFCTANVKPSIMEALDPEMILRYSALWIGDTEFQPETTPDSNIKFRGKDKVNHSGQQQLDVEVIYVK